MATTQEKLTQLNILIAGLKKDAQHIKESQPKFEDDMHRHAAQFNGIYREAYIAMELDNIRHRVDILLSAIFQKLTSLTFIKAQLEQALIKEAE